MAGLANVAGNEARGVFVSGLASVAGGDAQGLQVSGLANVTGGELRGLQLGGLANVAGALRGVQLAGARNDTVGGYGLQVAGAYNRSREELVGAQLAVFNRAGDVTAQIGLVNLARRVSGFQLGLVNLADEVSAPLGPVSWVRGGPRRVELWAGEALPAFWSHTRDGHEFPLGADSASGTRPHLRLWPGVFAGCSI